MKLAKILIEVLREQEAESDGEDFSKDASSVPEMLGRFKVLRLVLTDLLTGGNEGDLEQLLDSISIVTFKPTTFKITFKNGGSMNLKYDPTPMQIDPQRKNNYKAKDYFQCQIAGKRFSLENRSQYLQALEYIAQAMEKKPIGAGNNQATQDTQGAQEPEAEEPEGEPTDHEEQ